MGNLEVESDSMRRNLSLVRQRRAMARLFYGRRFFKSQHRMPGLAPAYSPPGDLVAALLGGWTSFVLGKIGEEEYTFIGECWSYSTSTNIGAMGDHSEYKDASLHEIVLV